MIYELWVMSDELWFMIYEWGVVSDEWWVYLIAPGGSALLVTPDGSLGIQTHPLTHLSASRRDALSNDNRDNADNWLSATRTELGCRIMLSVISNTNYHELTIN